MQARLSLPERRGPRATVAHHRTVIVELTHQLPALPPEGTWDASALIPVAKAGHEATSNLGEADEQWVHGPGSGGQLPPAGLPLLRHF